MEPKLDFRVLQGTTAESADGEAARGGAAAGVVAALAWKLYGFSIFVLGGYLLPLVANLIEMGWSIGIVTTAVILRYGERAEVLAWGIALLIQPFSAVFYPLNVLPDFLKPVAVARPSTHVFEGMREVILTGRMSGESLAAAFGLNAAYLTLALGLFFFMYHLARVQGRLTKLGE